MPLCVARGLIWVDPRTPKAQVKPEHGLPAPADTHAEPAGMEQPELAAETTAEAAETAQLEPAAEEKSEADEHPVRL